MASAGFLQSLWETPILGGRLALLGFTQKHGPFGEISLLLAGLGVGKGGTKLPHGPGQLAPGNVSGGKEAWLALGSDRA